MAYNNQFDFNSFDLNQIFLLNNLQIFNDFLLKKLNVQINWSPLGVEDPCKDKNFS